MQPHLQDFGNQSLLIFGGTYGNYTATKALFDEAKKLHIPPSRMICTGDSIAYIGQPLKTAQFLKAQNPPIVMIQGNCEESLVEGLDDCGCGFEENMLCSTLSNEWFAFCKSELDKSTIAWFDSLPKQFSFTFADKKCLVVHGSPHSINEFVFESETTKIQTLLSQSDYDYIIGGHSGLPFTTTHENKVWHNSGALGLPANDGENTVHYSLLVCEGDTVTFHHQTLQYDYKIEQEIMSAKGLSEHYQNTLVTGLWPSTDILPEAEKKRTGKALLEKQISITAQGNRQK